MTNEQPSTANHWSLYPVAVDASTDEITKNIYIDSPGVILRDYRFCPKLYPTDPTLEPNKIQLFYSASMYNEYRAHIRNQQLTKKRYGAIRILAKKLFNINYGSPKKYLLYDSTLRKELLRCITITIEDDQFGPNDHSTDCYHLLQRINLDPSTYRQSIYRQYCELLTVLLSHLAGIDVISDPKTIFDNLVITEQMISNGIIMD